MSIAAISTSLPAQQPFPIPTILKSAPAPDWNAKFANTEGWIGGDVVASVALSPKRILWLFGDTLLGTVKEAKRPGAKMVNNTLGIMDGLGKDATIRFVAGKAKDNSPAAFLIPGDGKGWFWPQSGIRVGDRLFIFLPQIEKTKDSGVFGFKLVAQWLAIVENPDAEPEKWQVKQHKIPFGEFKPHRERSWGSAALEENGHVYVFGYDHDRGKKGSTRKLIVARAPVKQFDDFTAWRFFTSKGWCDKPADSAPLADGLATEFTVGRLPGGKGFVTVYTEIGLSDRILGRFSNALEGPWSDPVLLYKCPEMAKDKGVFSYAGKAHAWAANGNELLLSYCVNTWDFARLFRENDVYRPKFVRVTLGAPPLMD